MAFADAAHGWAVGAAGTIVDTTDGGLTWAVQASSAPVATDLSGLAVAADALRGSAVGAAGTMLRTLDGGVADSTFPATTATGLQATRHAGWRNQAQTVSLAASDSGSGVAAVYYTVDAGSRQTYKGAFSVSGAGSHVVSYWAVDLVGNTETAHSGYVNIDTAAPACVAVANVKVARGKLATFSYRINDPAPSCGTALVKIAIYRGHKVVKTIRLTGVAENLKRACTYRVHLANGSYTWAVTATDAAGNAQRVVGRRGLSVVTWVIHNTADVQRCLIALRYLPSGAVSGTDDYRTEQALMAYQAWNGLVRDGRDGPKTRAQARGRHVAQAAPRVGDGPLRRSLPQPRRAALREQRQARARGALLDRAPQPAHAGRTLQRLYEGHRLVDDRIPRLDALRQLLPLGRRHPRLSRRAGVPGVARLRAHLHARSPVGLRVHELRRGRHRLLRQGVAAARCGGLRGERADRQAARSRSLCGVRQAHRLPAVALGSGDPGGAVCAGAEALHAERGRDLAQAHSRDGFAQHVRTATALAGRHSPVAFERGGFATRVVPRLRVASNQQWLKLLAWTNGRDACP